MDTRYWTMRRRGEDDAMVRAAQAAYHCETEIEAGLAAGLTAADFYTPRWAAWSAKWHDSRNVTIESLS